MRARKVHHSVYASDYTACGRDGCLVEYVTSSDRWTDVTCKRCLATRSKAQHTTRDAETGSQAKPERAHAPSAAKPSTAERGSRG